MVVYCLFLLNADFLFGETDLSFLSVVSYCKVENLLLVFIGGILVTVFLIGDLLLGIWLLSLRLSPFFTPLASFFDLNAVVFILIISKLPFADWIVF